MLEPFPFEKTLEVAFMLRRVEKSEIAKKGIARAYSETPEKECWIVLTARNNI